MSLDPMSTINKVEQFLREELSQAVAPELRSDIKAAAKLLNESVREIDQLAILLYDEAKAMAALCERAIFELRITSVIDADHRMNFSAWHSLTLSQQIQSHRQLLSQFDHMLIALAEQIKNADKPIKELTALLADALALQGQFAQQRLDFQSVFKA